MTEQQQIRDSLHCVLCRGRHPRRATVGQVCEPCRDRLDERLADIRVLHDCLPALLQPGASEPGGGSHGKQPSGPLPARLDVLNLLGPANDVHARYNLDALGDLQCQHGPMPTVVILDTLAEAAREQIGLDPGPVGQKVPQLVLFLRRQLDRICAVYDPLVDGREGFAAQVDAAWSMLKAVCGERKSTAVPIGVCTHLYDDGLECGIPLFAETESTVVQCRGCLTEWKREQWLLLGQVQTQEAS